jgi:hypothetical protein
VGESALMNLVIKMNSLTMLSFSGEACVLDQDGCIYIHGHKHANAGDSLEDVCAFYICSVMFKDFLPFLLPYIFSISYGYNFLCDIHNTDNCHLNI